VLCGPAVARRREAAIESIVVTDTVRLPPEKRLDKITVLNVASLFAAAIERIHTGESVGALFR
jgi:ribose-phosphate pyrophosphokinase